MVKLNSSSAFRRHLKYFLGVKSLINYNSSVLFTNIIIIIAASIEISLWPYFSSLPFLCGGIRTRAVSLSVVHLLHRYTDFTILLLLDEPQYLSNLLFFAGSVIQETDVYLSRSPLL